MSGRVRRLTHNKHRQDEELEYVPVGLGQVEGRGASHVLYERDNQACWSKSQVLLACVGPSSSPQTS